jgi:methylaspartate mutase epsilon subunit
MELSNRTWTDAELLERRREVLQWWPTGAGVDLDEALRFHRQLPEHKVFARKLDRLRSEGVKPIQVGLGHATIEETDRHCQLVEEGGADLVWIQVDTYTRRRQYDKAQKGIEESLRTGVSVLNGYPYVNHGVEGFRRIVDRMGVPLLLEGSSDEEPMLSTEIGLAGGGTANLQQDLRQLLAHSKRYPLAQRIINNQYNARLAAWYTERGAPIEGLVTGMIHGYVPSGMGSAIAMLQALLIARQGVKFISIMTASLYNLVFDAANMHVCRKLAKEYLERFGHGDVRVHIVNWPWEGNWPPDAQRAAAVASWQAGISMLGGADWIHLRSVHEGIGIPTPQANVASIKAGMQMRRMLAGQRLAESEEFDTEKRILELEVRAIVDKVLELGEGDPAIGEVRAVEAGVLDVAVTPWMHCRGDVLAMRDTSGVQRYVRPGAVPLPPAVLDYHRAKLAERERAEGRKADIEMAISDFHALSAR